MPLERLYEGFLEEGATQETVERGIGVRCEEVLEFPSEQL